MFLVSKPDRISIDSYLASAVDMAYSYPEKGATTGEAPAGYWNSDHNRVMIGQGEADWERAKQAVRQWKMFDLGWCSICWPDTPIEEDRNVAMMANHLGIWSLNAARIVYTFDQPNRFGFAYGTLADHVECGEERFSVELDPETHEVWYDLYSFSRPRHILAQIGYPYARYLQKSFVEDSKLAMIRACSGGPAVF